MSDNNEFVEEMQSLHDDISWLNKRNMQLKSDNAKLKAALEGILLIQSTFPIEYKKDIIALEALREYENESISD